MVVVVVAHQSAAGHRDSEATDCTRLSPVVIGVGVMVEAKREGDGRGPETGGGGQADQARRSQSAAAGHHPGALGPKGLDLRQVKGMDAASALGRCIAAQARLGVCCRGLLHC